MAQPKLPVRPILLLALLCFLARAGYITAYRERLDSLVISDMRTYDRLAVNLYEKGFYGIDHPWSYRPPLYPFFMSLIYRLGGHDYLLLRLVQAGLAAVSVALLYLLAARLADPRAAFLAGLFFSLDISLIHMSGVFLAENLYLPLSLLLLWLLLRGEERGKSAYFPAAGLAGGLAALCRPVVLPFLFLLGPLWLIFRRGLVGKWLLLLLGAALVIAPWTARNYRVHRRFIPVSTNGGVMLWMGLHHGAPGGYHFPPGNNPLYSLRDEVERNRAGYRESLRFIARYPGEFITLAGKKLELFWGADLGTGSGWEWAVFLFLGVAGFFASLRRWRKWLLLYLYLFAFFGVHLLAHSGPRYRLSLQPLVEIWAALFLVRLADRLRGRGGGEKKG